MSSPSPCVTVCVEWTHRQRLRHLSSSVPPATTTTTQRPAHRDANAEEHATQTYGKPLVCDESLAAVERPLLQATMCEADVNNQQQDRAVLGQLNCPQCGSLGRRYVGVRVDSGAYRRASSKKKKHLPLLGSPVRVHGGELREAG
ncbi:hypothetical protein F2P81_020318 [Scophthalmus maximus]|uniref:Uncharacterized protein n=1 Tax=Scophthalmus maximus TaxID=52904 RepID=A0A6A4S3H3_SCOMX|nr:hypothetical protein F2P81_020318 [Scophthalmus maximus]